MPAHPTALLLLAVALGAAGCGGDSEESAERRGTTANAKTDQTAPQRGTSEAAPAPEPRATPTVAEYRRTANRLCREDEAAVERFGDLNSPSSVEPYLRRVVRYARQRQPLYDRLRPPSDLRASHEDSKRLSERGIDTLARLLDRIEDGGDPGAELMKALPTIVRFTDESNRLARRMGVKDCIVDLPSPGAESPRSSS